MPRAARPGLLLAFVSVAVGLWLGGPDHPPPTIVQAAETGHQAFLVRFGVDDDQPRDWSGDIRVENGRVRGLDPWQFSGGDERLSGASWTVRTTSDTYWDAPWGRSLESTKRRTRLTAKGLLMSLELSGPGKVDLRTEQGEFSFNPEDLSWSRSQAFAGGRVVVSLSPSPQALTEGPAAEDHVDAIESSGGRRWVAYQTYEDGSDRLWVRRGNDPPEALTAPGGDLFRVRLAEDSQGRIWAVWCEQRESNWDLFARAFDGDDWGEEVRLTTAPGSDLFHSVARDGRASGRATATSSCGRTATAAGIRKSRSATTRPTTGNRRSLLPETEKPRSFGTPTQREIMTS